MTSGLTVDSSITPVASTKTFQEKGCTCRFPYRNGGWRKQKEEAEEPKGKILNVTTRVKHPLPPSFFSILPVLVSETVERCLILWTGSSLCTVHTLLFLRVSIPALREDLRGTRRFSLAFSRKDLDGLHTWSESFHSRPVVVHPVENPYGYR